MIAFLVLYLLNGYLMSAISSTEQSIFSNILDVSTSGGTRSSNTKSSNVESSNTKSSNARKKERRQFMPDYWPWLYVTPSSFEANSTQYLYKYDPKVGYEPYWPHPKWALNATRIPTRSPNCLYVTCLRIFLQDGPVCGRNNNFEEKTFENYCRWLDAFCEHPEEEWKLVLRGPCMGPIMTLRWTYSELASRAVNYVKDWVKTSPTTKIDSRETTTRKRSTGKGK